jgi:hypothetical protein
MTVTKSNDAGESPRGVATGIVDQIPRPGPEHELLQDFIGKWLTVGQTVAGPEMPSVPIFASDIYEWMPGRFFVLHTAYGRIGDIDVGGTEIISFDPTSQTYRTHFFDSQGNITQHLLTAGDGTWKWQGERTRCTSIVSDGGKVMTAHHERSDDGVHWAPSMEVTLTRVD